MSFDDFMQSAFQSSVDGVSSQEQNLKVDDDQLDFASVVCGMYSFLGQFRGWRSIGVGELATDRHKMLWMMKTSSWTIVWDHSRFGVEPAGAESFHYSSVFLLWVKDRVYQHSAFLRSAKASATLGFGILHSPSTIVSPWDGLTMDSRKVQKKKAYPNSQSMQVALRRSGLYLAADLNTGGWL